MARPILARAAALIQPSSALAIVLLSGCAGEARLVSKADDPTSADTIVDDLPLPPSFYGDHGIAPTDEVVGLRSAASYTFRTPKNHLISVVYPGAVNYTDELQRLRPIDLNIAPWTDREVAAARQLSPNHAAPYRESVSALEAETSAGFAAAYANTANTLKHYFGAKAADGVLVAASDQQTGQLIGAARWAPTHRIVASRAKTHSPELVRADVLPQAEGSRVIYRGTYPNTTEVYSVFPGALRHEIVLASPPPADSSADAALEFWGRLELSNDLLPYVDGEARPGDFATNTAIDFRDGRGNVVLRFDVPRAYELGNPHVLGPAEYRFRRSQSGELSLALAAPLEWLSDPSRTYPVVIDPDVITSTSTYSVSTRQSDGAKFDTSAADRVGRFDSQTYRAATRFPLSDIPTTIEAITNVTLQVYVTQTMADPVRLGRVVSDPESSAGATVFAESGGTCAGCNEYVNSASLLAGAGFQSQSLGAAAIGDVEAALGAGESWFAIGWRRTAEPGTLHGETTSVASFNPSRWPKLLVSISLPQPEPFMLLSPDNQASGISTRGPLRWNAAASAMSYRVRVSVNANLSSPIVDDVVHLQANLEPTAYSIHPPLAENSQYYWAVTAENASASTESSSGTWQFTTGEHPVRVWRGDINNWTAATYGSIQAAIDSIGGADISGWSTDAEGNAVVIEVRDSSVYSEKIVIDSTKVAGASASRRFALRGQAGHRPIIEYSQDDVYYVVLVDAVAGMTLENLDIANATGDGSTLAISLRPISAHDLRVHNCSFYGSEVFALFASVAGDNLELSHCTFRDNEWSAVVLDAGVGAVVHHSRFHDNGNRGLSIQTNGVTVHNSVFYNHTRRNRFNLFTSGTGHVFKNNTFSTGGYGVYLSSGSISAEQNIFHDQSIAGFRRVSGTATLDYNCWFDNAADVMGVVSKGANGIDADPLFVNSPAGDFHLHSEYGHVTNANTAAFVNSTAAEGTSPCIDAGNPNAAYDQETMPHGYRINSGAYGNTQHASRSAANECGNASNGSPCDDGNGCTQDDTCQSGVCVAGEPVVCAALDQCHNPGVCDPATGVCSNPQKAFGEPCDDGLFCTVDEACVSGVCSDGIPRDCSEHADPCNSGACNESADTCESQPAYEGNSCNDNDLCTQVDTCVSGVCVGSNPVGCTPLNSCHDVGVCDPATGVCSNPARANGTSCDDGLACTLNTTCAEGICVGDDTGCGIAAQVQPQSFGVSGQPAGVGRVFPAFAAQQITFVVTIDNQATSATTLDVAETFLSFTDGNNGTVVAYLDSPAPALLGSDENVVLFFGTSLLRRDGSGGGVDIPAVMDVGFYAPKLVLQDVWGFAETLQLAEEHGLIEVLPVGAFAGMAFEGRSDAMAWTWQVAAEIPLALEVSEIHLATSAHTEDELVIHVHADKWPPGIEVNLMPGTVYSRHAHAARYGSLDSGSGALGPLNAATYLSASISCISKTGNTVAIDSQVAPCDDLQFTDVLVPAGYLLTAVSSSQKPLRLRATGSISIEGRVDVSGDAGGDGQVGAGGLSSLGGSARAAGGSGGAANTPIFRHGSQPGSPGLGAPAACVGTAGQEALGQAGSGGGGGGLAGAGSTGGSTTLAGGVGGSIFGSGIDPFAGGGCGGAGGGDYADAMGLAEDDATGGGGGGGGGLLQLIAGGDILVAGSIHADGGNGGAGAPGAGGGGGGSGGAVWLQAMGAITGGGIVTALGGAGGLSGVDADVGSGGAGGAGGAGRIRLEDANGMVAVHAEPAATLAVADIDRVFEATNVASVSTDQCLDEDGDGICASVDTCVASSSVCDIGGTCFAIGERSAEDSCDICYPPENRFAWSRSAGECGGTVPAAPALVVRSVAVEKLRGGNSGNLPVLGFELSASGNESIHITRINVHTGANAVAAVRIFRLGERSHLKGGLSDADALLGEGAGFAPGQAPLSRVDVDGLLAAGESQLWLITFDLPAVPIAGCSASPTREQFWLVLGLVLPVAALLRRRRRLLRVVLMSLLLAMACARVGFGELYQARLNPGDDIVAHGQATGLPAEIAGGEIVGHRVSR